jgi:hypothetical protein
VPPTHCAVLAVPSAHLHASGCPVVQLAEEPTSVLLPQATSSPTTRSVLEAIQTVCALIVRSDGASGMLRTGPGKNPHKIWL